MSAVWSFGCAGLSGLTGPSGVFGLFRRQAGAALTALTLAALAGCALPPAADDRLAERVQALVDTQAQPFSGAIVLMRQGRVLHASGHGLADRAAGLPFRPDTPSDGGSLAKNFTAASLWWLAHEGRLNMQQAVQALVPEYPHAGVTVGQLLTHSGGLAPSYESFDGHFQPGLVRTTSALLALAGRSAPAPRFQPGSGFEYSDLGYDAAALVIERVSGQDYASFVRRRFFAPHGLVHSFARPARFADWPVPRTRGYRFEQGAWQDHDAYDDEAFLGASNLILAASDLARWGDAWAQARVLPAAAEQAGSAVPVLGGQRSALNALGWHCDASGLRCHNMGLHNGFLALVYWDRARRESLALVSNSALAPQQATALQNALAEALASLPTP